jgi:hypothetical protein
MHQLARVVALAVAIGVVAGCGKKDAPAYANVSGTVTYNGAPLAKGQITFQMEGKPPSSADIVDGKYTGQAMIGSNRVSISARRKAAKPKVLPETAKKQIEAYRALNKSGGGGFSDEEDPLTTEDYIPADYGKFSKQIRAVEAGAPNTFDFNIKGK